MTESLLKSNDVIFCEMMSHPVLFTHSHPKRVGIIGDENNGILSEVVKHDNITEIYQIKQPSDLIQPHDSRIQRHEQNNWFNTTSPHAFDVIISLGESNQDSVQHHFASLDNDGILIQASASPFDPQPLKILINQIKTIGFHDLHILNFPQPSYTSGWRTAVIALKKGTFKHLREKIIYNKSFKTHYYNFDIHRASLVLPEFMRETVI